jgi:YD repeat-containing protein
MPVIPSRKLILCSLLAPVLAAWAVPALGDTSLYQEQGKLIRAPKAVTVLGTDLFGDQVNLYTGGLSFVQNDVSLPGNSGLPVSIGRSFRTGVTSGAGPTAAFGNWDLEIPRMHGIFSKVGWTSTITGGGRCTNFGKPLVAPSSNGTLGAWAPDEFWHGSFLYVPGTGDQELLRRGVNPNVPADGKQYPIVTSKLWAVSCLPALKNGAASGANSGEGFLAVAPNGDRYQFDWIASRAAERLEKSDPRLQHGGFAPQPELMQVSESLAANEADDGMEPPTAPIRGPGDVEVPNVEMGNPSVLYRDEVWILPTLVTDRFGNTVTYDYEPSRPWQLKSITSRTVGGAVDRKISLVYVPNTDRISSVSDGMRNWQYAYDSIGYLDRVTLPDNSAWQLAGAVPLEMGVNYAGPPRCGDPGVIANGPTTGSMTHPSGAVAEFTLAPTFHGRAGVTESCRFRDKPEEIEHLPTYFATMALTKKILSGPGLTAMQWTTAYPPAVGSVAPCSGCVATKKVIVTDPSGSKTEHTFGTLFQQTEGQAQQADVFDKYGTLLRSTRTQYRDPAVGPFPDPAGYSEQGRGDGYLSSRIQVTQARVTSQQGVDFTWKLVDGAGAPGVDVKGRAVHVARESALGIRRELTTYKDILDKWILGQVEKVTESTSNTIPVLNEYDPINGALKKVTRFGRVDQSMTYYADGTLATKKDGLNQTTTFGNYKLGLARAVLYADGSGESAEVNNIGLIEWTKDPVDLTTRYGYDTVGRMASITHPDNVPAWTGTTLKTVQSWSWELGLAPGHWTQTITTGNALTTTYLDALLRPVYTHTVDITNPNATARVVQRGFDEAGHSTYESYPKRTAAETSLGVRTEYDALGRVVATTADSGLGVVRTSATYIDGFRKTVTDARNHSTTMSYQAFDAPTEGAITKILAPLSVQVQISRDVDGKPQSITRSGGGKSATRSYVYDSFGRLCKTIEPETGATVQQADLANNISWRASGLNLPAAACDLTSVAAASKTSFSYDARNRLKNTDYGDGSPGIARTYTLDGLPETINSGGANWTYGYNTRRLNTSESLSYGGVTYAINRLYDANGSLAQLKYPDNKTVDYTPNALGEPTMVGQYAKEIKYYPNGAISGFTYGNGIVHTMVQNARGLPERSIDAGVINDAYIYDPNANVQSISDSLQGVSTRSMEYDDLDRLKRVNAPAMWGDAWYDYDGLDNITNSNLTGGNGIARLMVHGYDAKNRLETIGGTAPFAVTYGYDAQGNITRRGGQYYTFDQANRLKAAVGKATYAYDGLGHRMSIVKNDGNLVQVYSAEGQLLYSKHTNGVGTKYIYLKKHQIAEVKQ